jgi:hypothetical protein
MPFNKASYNRLSFNQDAVERREVTGFVASINGTATRVLTADRAATGFVSTVDGAAQRTITVDRAPTGFVDTISGNSTRVLTADRTPTGFVASINGTATRVLTADRAATGFVSTVDGAAQRTITVDRAPTGFVDTISGNSTRVLTADRTPTGFVASIVGSAARGYTDWAIEPGTTDPTMILASSLTADAQTVSLSFEVHRDEIDAWRRFDRAGDISVESGFAGQYRAIDRGARSGPTRVEPPVDQEPPFPRADYFVTSYGEEQVAPDRFQVDMTFQRLSNRGQEFGTLSEAGDWEFALETGTVGLDAAQVSPASGSGTTAGPEFELQLRIGDDQAAALMDNWGYPEGVVERPVGDGEDYLVDQSPDSRQTVTVTSPSGAAIDDDDYLVTGWQIETAGFEASRRWSVDVTFAES